MPVVSQPEADRETVISPVVRKGAAVKQEVSLGRKAPKLLCQSNP